MKRLDTITVIAALGIFLWACFLVFSAKAEPVCFPDRETMEHVLVTQFGETPDKVGLVGDNMAELYVSPEGSWSLVIHMATGAACVVAGGDAWSDAPKQPGEAL